ncbi:unnamed protein product, partial [Chrysoparadoxa australica]
MGVESDQQASLSPETKARAVKVSKHNFVGAKLTKRDGAEGPPAPEAGSEPDAKLQNIRDLVDALTAQDYSAEPLSEEEQTQNQLWLSGISSKRLLQDFNFLARHRSRHNLAAHARSVCHVRWASPDKTTSDWQDSLVILQEGMLWGGLPYLLKMTGKHCFSNFHCLGWLKHAIFSCHCDGQDDPDESAESVSSCGYYIELYLIHQERSLHIAPLDMQDLLRWGSALVLACKEGAEPAESVTPAEANRTEISREQWQVQAKLWKLKLQEEAEDEEWSEKQKASGGDNMMLEALQEEEKSVLEEEDDGQEPPTSTPDKKEEDAVAQAEATEEDSDDEQDGPTSAEPSPPVDGVKTEEDRELESPAHGSKVADVVMGAPTEATALVTVPSFLVTDSRRGSCASGGSSAAGTVASEPSFFGIDYTDADEVSKEGKRHESTVRIGAQEKAEGAEGFNEASDDKQDGAASAEVMASASPPATLVDEAAKVLSNSPPGSEEAEIVREQKGKVTEAAVLVKAPSFLETGSRRGSCASGGSSAAGTVASEPSFFAIDCADADDGPREGKRNDSR